MQQKYDSCLNFFMIIIKILLVNFERNKKIKSRESQIGFDLCKGHLVSVNL